MDYTIEIVSPINGKGLGRKYRAIDKEIVDESNYIELGAVVRDENNNPVNDVVMSVETGDPTQNRAMTGTGNVYPVRGKKKIITPYYPFHYCFKKKGEHTITFSVGDVSESVEVMVGENKPK